MNQTFKDRLREWEGPFDWINGSELAAEADQQLASKDAEIARLREASDFLDWLEQGPYDLKTEVTDEDDYYWIVVSHHQSKPHERVIGHGATPRLAIEEAQLAVDNYNELHDFIQSADDRKKG